MVFFRSQYQVGNIDNLNSRIFCNNESLQWAKNLLIANRSERSCYIQLMQTELKSNTNKFKQFQWSSKAGTVLLHNFLNWNKQQKYYLLSQKITRFTNFFKIFQTWLLNTCIIRSNLCLLHRGSFRFPGLSWESSMLLRWSHMRLFRPYSPDLPVVSASPSYEFHALCKAGSFVLA